MAPRGYTAIPNPHRASINDRANLEMDRAFESDDEDDIRDSEATPLTKRAAEDVQESTERTGGMSAHHPSPNTRQDEYDFENVYDHPPPGSPPPMHSALQPAVGNSNGVVPSFSSTTLPTPPRSRPNNRPSFFRRAVGVLLPSHYARVPTTDSNELAPRHLGSGMQNDGVFSNVLAKPTTQRTVQSANGEVYVMPEETQKDAPPSYADAQADSVPPYWETTVVAPHIGSDDILIDGLPTGSVMSFAWNFLVSMTFQYVGFMLTYLMHTTHAAKYGSRAGLGITLIQYGLFSRDDDAFGQSDGSGFGPKLVKRLLSRSLSMGDGMVGGMSGGMHGASDPAMMSSDSTTEATAPTQDQILGTSAHDWLTFFLMTAGWFLFLSSVLGYARVKRWERGIRSSTPRSPPSPDEIIADAQVRARIQAAFGIEPDSPPQSPVQQQVPQPQPHPEDQTAEVRNAQLMRMLRESGFL